MNEPTKLDAGMLLLDPEGKTVYTVVSAKTIIAHHGSCSERATLTKSGLPEGWRIINNRELAGLLVDHYGTPPPPPPAAPPDIGHPETLGLVRNRHA